MTNLCIMTNCGRPLRESESSDEVGNVSYHAQRTEPEMNSSCRLKCPHFSLVYPQSFVCTQFSPATASQHGHCQCESVTWVQARAGTMSGIGHSRFDRPIYPRLIEREVAAQFHRKSRAPTAVVVRMDFRDVRLLQSLSHRCRRRYHTEFYPKQ